MNTDTYNVSDKVLELSTRLNSYLQEYQVQTVLVQALLDGDDDEESLFKIKDALDRREALIASYDQTALEFKQEQAHFAKDRPISEDVRQKLDSLETERQAILGVIRDIENRSMKRMSELYNYNRGHIKQIEEGKKLMNAYQSSPQVTDGVFFDRRK